MPDAAPTHDAVYIRQLAEDLKRKGLPVARMLAEAGLAPRVINGERARVPVGKYAAFLEAAAEATGDDRLGLHFAITRDVRDAGLIGYVGLSSPTWRR